MRFSYKLALALSAFALVSSAFAELSTTPANGLSARDDVPTLVKRTSSNGSSKYSCSNTSNKLVHSGGSCSCKSSCGSKETECAGPKTKGTGDAVCTSSGCSIDCHVGMVLKNGDCTCQSGYELASCGTYCQLKCSSGKELYNGKCVAKCDTYETRNNKGTCECKTSCSKKGNSCTPDCPSGASWSSSKDACVCATGTELVNSKCVATCGKYESRNSKGNCVCKESCSRKNTNSACTPSCPDHASFSTKSDKCVCDTNYTSHSGACVPQCGDNMKWNGSECVCVPGCKKHSSGNYCTPGASQAAGNTNSNGHNKHSGHKREAPVWSSKLHTRTQDSLFCPDQLNACPIPQSLGGYECVDLKTELEQCGGCIADGEGQDCTQIPNVAGVGCQNGTCVVFSCAEGFSLTSSGECAAGFTTQGKRARHFHSSA